MVAQMNASLVSVFRPDDNRSGGDGMQLELDCVNDSVSIWCVNSGARPRMKFSRVAIATDWHNIRHPQMGICLHPYCQAI
jgi:hypothetical protein